MRVPVDPTTVRFASPEDARAWAASFAAQLPFTFPRAPNERELAIAGAIADQMLEVWRSRRK